MKSARHTDSARVFVPPPAVYLAFFLTGLALQRVAPLPRATQGWLRGAGALLALVGAVLALWAVQRFRHANTNVLPMRPTTTIVAEGPYRFTRNPMYLGMLLFYAGAALWLAQLWPLILLPVLVVVVQRFVIAREERYLSGKFGEEYNRYRARVRRWL